MMKKIGIIGGTFDPVHYGHLILAEQARVEAGIDGIVFMPAMVQPFKLNKEIANGEHRYAMLKAAVAGNPFFSVSKQELDAAGISYTIDTLRQCEAEYGEDTQIFFIIGTDAFLNLEKWKESEALLRDFSFIVGTRPGYKERELEEALEKVKRQYQTTVIKINNSEVEISSTDIKNRISENKSIKYLLPEAVESYIYENNLYHFEKK